MNIDTVNLFDPAVVADPYAVLAELRRREPVYRIPGTSFYVVTRWDLVAECQARVADFSSNLTGLLVDDHGHLRDYDLDAARRGTHVLATGDDPDHRAHRKLVLPALTARRIAALEPFVAATVSRLWDAGVAHGRIEWMSALGDALPMELVARLIGLPRHDVPLLRDLSYASTDMLSGVVTSDGLPHALTAAVELAGYLHSAFVAARTAPGDDLLGDLVRACAAGELAPDVAVLIVVQLVGAGGESTAGLLGNAAGHLAGDPALAAVLRREPERIPAFLDEVLRLESPFKAHLRHVVADTTLAGVDLPGGAHLVLSWSAANRDPAVFPEPDHFVLDRPNIRSLMAFGRGIHFCVGAALARLEARIAIEYLLERSAQFRIVAAEWHPSTFVRRLDRLELEL